MKPSLKLLSMLKLMSLSDLNALLEMLKSNKLINYTMELIKYLGRNRNQNVIYKILYSVFSKKYYWYEIKFIYRDKSNGTVIFNFKDQCGFTYQDTCLSKRKIKKVLIPLHKNNRLKPYLCNGVFDCEIICYLGRFNNRL